MMPHKNILSVPKEGQPLDLLANAEADVKSLSKIHPRYWQSERYKILKKFVDTHKHPNAKILSVGCGPKEPLIINATHACDITPLSYEHLKKAGWNGTFEVHACPDLPYGNKSFDVVVCSEVIEHLPTIEDVIKTFKEISRVGKKWIISTPNLDIEPKHKQNKHHLQFWNKEDLKQIIPVNYQIYTNDTHIYIESI